MELEKKDNKPIIIAELSSNHLGDLGLAEEMIASASESGADIVKFQTWEVKKLKKGPWDQDGRREIYRKAELSQDDHFELKSLCEKYGVEFLTSCFSESTLDFVRLLSNKVKIPGVECRNVNLVRAAIDMFDVVYISTGATLKEEYLQWAHFENVYLLHCVSSYPCLSENINMPRMISISKHTSRFGYSGHYDGIWDAIYAISLGAKVIEKHFTIDKGLPFRDNKFAILPKDMLDISRYRDEMINMSKKRGKDYQECEIENREVYSGRWSI